MVSFVRAPRVLEAPPEVPLDSSQRAIVHMAASLLLDYPAEGSLETRLNAVEAELAALPPEVAVLLEESSSLRPDAAASAPWPSTTWRSSTGVGAAACT